jgi:hypothetical protein
MSGYPPPGPSVGERFEEAMEQIEMELRHAIAYLNDAVIPVVRKESISAMRKTADTLRNLADRFERQSTQAGSGGGNPSPNTAPNQTGERRS